MILSVHDFDYSYAWFMFFVSNLFAIFFLLASIILLIFFRSYSNDGSKSFEHSFVDFRFYVLIILNCLLFFSVVELSVRAL